MIPNIWKSASVLPLLKGGDPSVVNNYRPISKQLEDILDTDGNLSQHQSGFRKQHSTITAAIKVMNKIEVLNSRTYCAALFIDLSEALETVNYVTLEDKFYNIDLSRNAVSWFSN